MGTKRTLTTFFVSVIIALSPLGSTLFAAEDGSVSGFELVPFSASYSAKLKKGISLSGTAIRELKKLDDGRWKYQFNVDSLPVDIRESVEFTWQDGQVRPNNYHYSLSGMLVKDKKRSIRFNWKQLLASGKSLKDSWKLSFPQQALDRLSYQVQLVLDIANGKKEMDYQVVHKGRIEESQFRVLKTETIDTRIGKQESIVVEKVRSPDRPRKTLLWFSKSNPLLLLKMYQLEKNGEEYEIELLTFSHATPPAKT